MSHRIQTLGTRGLGLSGWTVAEDGTIAQDSATESGVVLLPLHVEEKRTLRSLLAKFRRATFGALPEVAPTMQLQRRLDQAVEEVWTTVPGAAVTYAATEGSTLETVRVDFGASRAFAPTHGYSYRLRITGEDGANAQSVELVEVEAV